MTVGIGIGGGAKSDTTGDGTVAISSLLCEPEPSRGIGCGVGRVCGSVDVSGSPCVAPAAAMSSEVIERGWLSRDTGIDCCGASGISLNDASVKSRLVVPQLGVGKRGTLGPMKRGMWARAG